MIGKALEKSFSLTPKDKEELIELYPLAEYNERIHKIFPTHDDDPQFKKAEKITTDKQIYSNKKVIFLVRDPRDVIVSSYFQHKKRLNQFSGDLNSYIFSDTGNIDSIIKFYNVWYKNRNIPKDFLLIRYEDMQEDTLRELKRVLKFIGITNLNSEALLEIVDYASFDNMRQMEQNNQLNSSRLQPADKSDEESYKTRRGKVGGYSDYLSEQEINYLNQKINDKLADYFKY
jgi:hypothetical protein